MKILKAAHKMIWFFALFWFMGFMYFVTLVPTEQVDNGRVVTDAAIVLTGGNKRIEEGFNILKEKKSKKLFITGVGKKVKDKEIVVLYGNLDYLNNNKVEFGRRAVNTTGNAVEARSWVESNNIKTITLVTANYHMPRSSLEFKKVLSGVKIIEHPVFPPTFKIKKLWSNPGSVLLLVKEYNKTLWLLYEQNI